MKILWGALVVDGRNKIGGQVASKNRYGAYMRNKVTPVNPQSTAQQNVRAAFAANSQAWRGLTDAERQSWIDAAPSFPIIDIFGNSKILAGNALYQSLNSNLSKAAIAAINTAPAPEAVPSVATLAITADESTGVVSIAWTETPVPAGTALLLYMTPCVGAGISFVKNKFRLVEVITATTASPATVDVLYGTVFGPLVVGQKIYVRAAFMSITTGQQGIPLEASTTVVA